ncbi:DEAD/DEAH box helicase family protein [Heliorestis convoluta]|uniref:DEAD/DEAH box helicase n=1 Tax=Heliorestis convoluta TaxID=356322 RepID=A0A5Q2N1K5_9FIRM|nr:DEAD/DEAH box helicase [Heliorestis convoluta]QGG47476.1 DEAD/DEAH box helicase [Heliorestis convoluta]
MVCLKGFVYVARGKGKSWLGFTHDPALDLTILRQENYETVVSLTPTLPVGVALYVLQELRQVRDYQRSSVFLQGVEKVDQIWRKALQSLSWGIALPGLAKESSPQYAGKKVHQADEELRYWSQQAAKLLREIQELPLSYQDQYVLHLYGPTGPIIEEEVVTDMADLQMIAEILEGRILYMAEIEKALTDRWRQEGLPFPAGNLEDMMHLLALVGAVEIFPSLTVEGKDKARCIRCGQSDRIVFSPCVRCGRDKCYYCEGCLSMGESRLCRPLYALAGDEGWLEKWEEKVMPYLFGGTVAPSSPNFLGKTAPDNGSTSRGYPAWPVLPFPLTEAQEEAGEDLLLWLAKKEQKEAIVWAACGAGKTEVAFAAIARLLQQGGRVLFAVPRRDVVLELEPRIQKAFPGVSIVTLYGGSTGKYDQAQLVIATTHQVIRFYRAFDLVVLDEVDAFPYQGSEMLYHAVMRSKKKEGRIVFMTATPDKKMKEKIKKKDLALVTIPARHHGHPVPEPKMIIQKEWRWKREQLIFPEKLLRFLHRSVEGDLAQVFIFVPSIFLAQRVGEA